MRAKVVVFTVLALLLSLCAMPVYANGVPPLPHTFCGKVFINGQPAPIGTEVKAVCTNVMFGIFGGSSNPLITTEVGKYGDSGQGGARLIVQGDIQAGTTIKFYVNGVDTGQTYPFASGTTKVLDLSVTINIATPTVTTNTAALVTTTSATLNGYLSSLGTASSVTVSFEWGTTTSYGSETTPTTKSSTGSFSATLSSLTPANTYHFRAKLVGRSTGYGTDVSFITAATGGGGITSLAGKTSNQGVTTQTVTAKSEDGTRSLTIGKDTKVLDRDGSPLSQIVIAKMAEPAPSENTKVIGPTSDFGPDGATFNPPITLEFSYATSDIPNGVNEEDLSVAYYDKNAAKWVELKSTVNTATNTITASISHFTAFAILGHKVIVTSAATLPADFTISSLTVSPAEAAPGETVTISILIANIGGQSSNYQVTLKIDGAVEAIGSATVAAGATKQVSFTSVKNVAGTYSVDVNGLTGSFMVKEALQATPAPSMPPAPPAPPSPPAPAKAPTNWPVLGGIIAGVVVVALLIFFLARRRAYY